MNTSEPTTPEREILSYEDFGVAVKDLATQIARDNWVPDFVLSIARGGLPIGGALGYAMNVKNVSVVNVEFYTGVDQRLDVPVMLPPTPDAIDLSGAKVLIADDVADTGKTLELVREFYAGHVAEARIAVLYHKPHSIIEPNYVWKKTDQWIDFPWSSFPVITPETVNKQS